MKKTIYLLLILCFLIASCKAQSPFASSKEKKESLSLVKESLNLTGSDFRAIKNKDSIVFELDKSIKDTINPKLIKRRLDSFILKNYTEKQLFKILKIDRSTTKGVSSPWIFEFTQKEEGKNYIDLNPEDIERVVKKMDKALSEPIKVDAITGKKIKDSLNYKN